MKVSLWTPALAVASVLTLGILAGCGGGSTPATTRGVDIYVTDQFADQYSHVWVTLQSIAVGDGKTFTDVYSATTGKTIDIVSLKDTAELLSSIQLADTRYTHIRVTYSDTVTLVDAGGTSTTIQVAPSPSTTVGGGLAIHTSATRVPFKASTNRQLVVDFNLASFEITGGKLRVGIVPEPPIGFDGKFKRFANNGQVSNLTATSFVMTGGDNRPPVQIQPYPLPPAPKPGMRSSINVTFDANTVVLGPDGPGASLANGQKVVVRGTYDDASKTLTATEINIVPMGGANPGGNHGIRPGDDTSVAGDHIGGIVTDIDEANGIVTIKPREANHATSGNLVKISISATDQVLLGQGGRPKPGTLSGISIGDAVSARGVLSPDGSFDADVIIVRLAPDCVFPPPASN
ncbi:MAG: hypothetical protein RL169_166 [Armatimonadota bacterium]|jgi:hypothetical protein